MAAYYVQKDGGHFGPLSRDELQQYIAAGVLSVEDWAIEEGKDAWVPLGTYVQMPAEPAAVAGADPASASINPTTESAGGGMALAGVILLLMAGGTFGAWQMWGGKFTTTGDHPQKEIEVSVLSPWDIPQPPPPPKIEPLPTNNLPAAVAEELIFISPENLEPLQTRAKDGDAEAMLELARRHETGWGVRWDLAAAFKWAENAAEKNEPRARVLLAFYCMSRIGTNRVDVQRAAQLEETGDANGALELVRKMADEGDAASLTILGLRNKPRRGFSGNPELAYRQFRLAADLGDVQALYWVGMMEGQGVGTERNIERAARWIATAAEQGQTLSISLLGLMHIQQLGLPENPDEGVRLIREAAEMGMPKARYRLGYMYLKGNHLAMDVQQACVWFFLAYEGTSLARPYLKKLREEMDPADYDRALAEAAKLDDTFTDPELPAPDPDEPPKPPFIEKPTQSNVAKPLPLPSDPELPAPDPNEPPKPPFIEKPTQSDVAKPLPLPPDSEKTELPSSSREP
jgi:TPR repeat protein